VLGELVDPDDRPVWTASLLYVMEGMGFGEQAARQAIARGSAAGWIEPERQGREVRWTLTAPTHRLFEEGARRVFSLSSDPPRWDGNWLVLLISIPQERSAVRKKLYGALSWTGFGNPTPGVWLTPHTEREAEAKRTIDELGLGASTLSFVGAPAAIGLSDREIVEKAWNLEEIASNYAALLERFSGLRPEPGDDVLYAHLELADALRRFPFFDPQLPDALLPDWIGRRAARQFADLRAEWFELAHARWREIVELTSVP
jgi:phenylacetic acid degradation operon negative regulatory protein